MPSSLLTHAAPNPSKRVRTNVPSMRRVALPAALASLSAGCFPEKIPVEVGSPAPEISLVGATRDGVLSEPLRLEDFRGQTVVLAFFFKARTPG